MTQKVVTPSGTTITVGQIGKICDLLTAGLRKAGLLSEPTQQVIETQGDSLVAEMVAAVRRYVEAASNMFSRRVRVNRALTPDQVINNTGRVRGYIDETALATMPGLGSEPEGVEVCFFELDYDPTPAELAKEYEFRNLAADAAALAKAVTDYPALADERPVVCQWNINKNGVASYAVFYRRYGKREVLVFRDDNRWSRSCRFAGVRK